jgi:hypothetical protein
MDMIMINRRQFLQVAGAGALSLAAEGLGSLLVAPSAFAEVNAGSEFEPDLDILLTAQPRQVPIFPGTPTGVWSFQGQVLEGDPRNLINLDRSYLGPIIKDLAE